QQRRLTECGFSPVILRGEQSKEERDEIWEKLESGKSKFIIANPEILLTEQIKRRIEKINIVHVVIDEAHCVSEWGETFRPSYLQINSIIDSINPPLITAFTATASAPVLEKIRKYIFGDIQARQIVGNPDRPNISYSAKGCINRDLAVRDLLIENSRPAIVFCSSRPGTAKLAHYLRNELEEMGYGWYKEIRFYHAGLTREEKKITEEWLLHNTEAVLCSTCAFGMGVDKADVRTVIHRDCPPSVEAYLQESGRAGRDGKQSKAILLWGPDDEGAMARARKEADKNRLLAVLNYARDDKNCRRHALLSLLNYDSGGEVPENNCCDVCHPAENKTNSNLREESSILNFFKKNKRRFTQSEASSVLAAGKSIRWSEEEASRVIGYLLKTKKLRRLRLFPWKNKITL
ncbi:MAG: RecQ family zinc-binding domain-containing protein, partial [Treponema sp.]|nr:RecQ family zinc-binding domain-containing protein [Treponema sp.]